MKKTLLLVSFTPINLLDKFLEKLKNKFNIDKKDVFCYENLDDSTKYIVTYKINILNNDKINFNEIAINTISIHKKDETLYTINALNKLIDNMTFENIGNIDYKAIKIDWSLYKNQFILTKNNELMFLKIKRVF